MLFGNNGRGREAGNIHVTFGKVSGFILQEGSWQVDSFCHRTQTNQVSMKLEKLVFKKNEKSCKMLQFVSLIDSAYGQKTDYFFFLHVDNKFMLFAGCLLPLCSLFRITGPLLMSLAGLFKV